MKINSKQLEQLINEQLQIEIKKIKVLKKLNEVNRKIKNLNEGDLYSPKFNDNLPPNFKDPAFNDELKIQKYEFVNNNNDIEVYVKGFLPVEINGDTFVTYYEKRAGKDFPSVMSVEEILTSFENTNHDISELLLSFIDENVDLEPNGLKEGSMYSPEEDDNLPKGFKDPAFNDDLEIESYDLINGDSEIEVYIKGYNPITIDGDKFVDFYEKQTQEPFPSFMSYNDVLKTFRSTNYDITDLLLDFIIDEHVDLESGE